MLDHISDYTKANYGQIKILKPWAKKNSFCNLVIAVIFKARIKAQKFS